MTIGATKHDMRRLVHRLHPAMALNASRAFRVRRPLRLIDPVLPGTGRRRGDGEVWRERSGGADARGRDDDLGSSKHQAPNSKEAPTTKHQTKRARRGTDLWSLGFGASLELGAWDLELHQYVSVTVKIPL